jgi:hypothetical protein
VGLDQILADVIEHEKAKTVGRAPVLGGAADARPPA